MSSALSQNYQPLFAPYSKLFKELKTSIKILPGQAVLELLISLKQYFDCFDSLLKNPLGLLKFESFYLILFVSSLGNLL